MRSRMGVTIASIVALIPLLVIGTNLIFAAEHPGEHPGQQVSESKEHPGESSHDASSKASKALGASQIKSAIKEYIETDQRLKNGYFYIYDEKSDRDWKLQFDGLHPVRTIERAGATIYFACSDFSVIGSDDDNTVDLDFWMKLTDGELKPTQIRIHKIDGTERFTYENDEPVQTSP